MTDPIRRFRATGDADAFCAAVPYLSFLGVRFEVRGDDVLATLPFAEHLIGNHTLPALHGGAISALLEATATMKVLWSAPTEKLPKVVDVTVDFLRSARAVDSYARSTIIKQGRRIVSVHTTSWQGDPTKPIATAHTHFLLRPLDDQTS